MCSIDKELRDGGLPHQEENNTVYFCYRYPYNGARVLKKDHIIARCTNTETAVEVLRFPTLKTVHEFSTVNSVDGVPLKLGALSK